MVIIPVYNVVVLPFTEIYLQIDKLRNVNEEELKVGNQVLFLFSKNNTHQSILNMDSFYSIGVICLYISSLGIRSSI